MPRESRALGRAVDWNTRKKEGGAGIGLALMVLGSPITFLFEKSRDAPPPSMAVFRHYQRSSLTVFSSEEASVSTVFSFFSSGR
jgi:hypothetical protein